MDRAERVYESMLLRGFKGDFNAVKKKVKKTDIIFPVVWIVIFILIRWRVIL
jgi:cobalt/nickel transport system permease protein